MWVQIRSKKLLLRSCQQWVDSLRLIESPSLRSKVASIVWWDYARACWPSMGEFALGYDPEVCLPTLDVRIALRLVGYSARAAKLRSRIPQTSLTYGKPKSAKKRATRREMTLPDAVPQETPTPSRKRWLL